MALNNVSILLVAFRKAESAKSRVGLDAPEAFIKK
jgi:hypothetical protein